MSGGTAGPPVRILFLATVRPGDEDRFLKAYDSIRDRVASAPGHLSEQLCQNAKDPTEWLITSEWASAEAYRGWAAQHRFAELSDPITQTISDRRHTQFVVRRSTDRP